MVLATLAIPLFKCHLIMKTVKESYIKNIWKLAKMCSKKICDAYDLRFKKYILVIQKHI